ncbi:DUF488 domain-containing protein [Agriterribacter sp.]|uniref:DUF488 domain-containing protein n=1 Tax=Agriterribacter sp. TaxID=2821509 RepID=UPI002BFACD14|nr:DUF488 domain-containing protein [Agriterribacter sp.]HRP58324.1 DUF488 domain-containing protein [Agriterribacter sp.]
MSVQIKRVYEPFAATDGFRVLVDRIWPRGIKKEAAHADVWLKEVAPSTALRKWFNHEPGKWPEFTRKYIAELKRSGALEQLLEIIRDHKKVTLLYAAHDEQHNQALVLQEFIKTLVK